MTSHRLVVLPYVALLLSVVALAPHGLTTQTEPFDLVLAGGRVLDPETGLDATRNVGIREGRIAAVTVEPLEDPVPGELPEEAPEPEQPAERPREPEEVPG